MNSGQWIAVFIYNPAGDRACGDELETDVRETLTWRDCDDGSGAGPCALTKFLANITIPLDGDPILSRIHARKSERTVVSRGQAVLAGTSAPILWALLPPTAATISLPATTIALSTIPVALAAIGLISGLRLLARRLLCAALVLLCICSRRADVALINDSQ